MVVAPVKERDRSPYFFPRLAAFFLTGAFLVDLDFCALAMVVMYIGLQGTWKAEVIRDMQRFPRESQARN